MFDFAFSLLMAIHLLAVNIASAAPLVAIWHEWKEHRGDVAAGQAGRALLWYAVAGTGVGALLGLLAGWTLWDDGLAAALDRVPSKVYYGVWEIFFSLALTVAHVVWWRANPKSGAWQRAVRTFLALLASTNLLYHFPVLFSVITELIHRNELVVDVIDAREFRTELVSGAAIARTIHFLFAAIATCGIVLMLHVQHDRFRYSSDQRKRVAVWGARWALAATIAQIPVGLWLLTRLSTEAQNRLMGRDIWGTGMFAFALLMALWLAHTLASIAFGETNRRLIYRCTFIFLIVVWLMTGASRRAFAPLSVGTHAHEVRQNRSIA